MGRSLALGLYLLLADRAGAPAVPPERAVRPDGTCIWLHSGKGSRQDSLRQLIRLIARQRPEAALVLTADDPATLAPMSAALTDRLPEDRPAEVCAFLDHWRPDAGLFLGATLPPALIVEAHSRHIPLVLADVQAAPNSIPLWRRGMTGSVLGRFRRILAQDPETVAVLQKLGGRQIAAELGGRIEETTDPLPCAIAERDALAEILRARPIWLAAACCEAEEEAVIAAHVRAMRHAHRLLLIVAPADPARAPELARKLSARGLVVALRAEDEDPVPEAQVLIADGTAELGLWYRLAPVCYMGGTLLPGGAGRSPHEPAALGSAILHGPYPGPYPDAYARLSEARATRAVGSPEALSAAVEELIAPDAAAVLAHNAWAATSGGAEVAERVVQVFLSALDAASEKGSAR